MGIIRLPEVKLYWSKNNIFTFPIFSETIPYKLFLFLSKYLHFNDSKKEKESTDKLYKILPVIAFLNNKWKENGPISDKYTIDETVIPWTGRLCIKQNLPKKPNKYGIKIFSIANSYNGYAYNWDIYKGKGGKTEDIKLRLINNCNIRHSHIFMDSYFGTMKTVKI